MRLSTSIDRDDAHCGIKQNIKLATYFHYHFYQGVHVQVLQKFLYRYKNILTAYHYYFTMFTFINLPTI